MKVNRRAFGGADAVPALLALCLADGAAAETVKCTAVATLPYAITAAGAYCLTAPLGIGSGTAIVVDAPGVTLDLDGFSLTGGPGGTGILVKNWKDVTVRNGTVAGFGTGIELAGGGAERTLAVVENLRLRNNTLGIVSAANGALLRHNVVVASGPQMLPFETCGIQVSGTGSRVLDNDLWGEQATAIVIDAGCNGCLVEGNRIGLEQVYARGVYVKANDAFDVVVANNRIAASLGIACENLTQTKECTLKDNVVYRSSTEYLGVFADAGGNFPVVP